MTRTSAVIETEVDEYAVTAEFYDLWARGHWEALAPSLRRAMGSQVDPDAGSVLDLGAGSGWGTLAIADAFPDVSIIATEPSRAMRTMLFSKVTDRSDICRRVTVVPCDFETLRWPDRLSGFVAVGMLGHLTRVDRMALWNHLAEHLAPGAPAVVQLQAPDRPVKVPLTRHSVVDVGERTYEGWCSASPIGRRALCWTLRCVVRHGDRIIDEHTCDSIFRTVSFEDVRSEATAAGLTIVGSSGGLITLAHD